MNSSSELNLYSAFSFVFKRDAKHGTVFQKKKKKKHKEEIHGVILYLTENMIFGLLTVFSGSCLS